MDRRKVNLQRPKAFINQIMLMSIFKRNLLLNEQFQTTKNEKRGLNRFPIAQKAWPFDMTIRGLVPKNSVILTWQKTKGHAKLYIFWTPMIKDFERCTLSLRIRLSLLSEMQPFCKASFNTIYALSLVKLIQISEIFHS